VGEHWDAIVVGAGVAGAFMARMLTDSGRRVLVLDKGRGPGGRTSTRRVDETAFDHGAQYATFRSGCLEQFREQWLKKGWLAPWDGPFYLHDERGLREVVPTATRYVGVPGMNQLVSGLLEGISTVFGEEVCEVHDRGDQGALLETRSGQSFTGERVCITLPAPQAAHLLSGFGGIGSELERVRFAPCLVAMLTFEGDTSYEFGGMGFKNEKVSWVARNQSKPGRPPGEQWVIHGSSDWSREYLEESREWIADELHQWVHGAFPGLPQAHCKVGHRWKYALVEQAVGRSFMTEGRISVCGDGMLGGKVEAALLSALSLYESWTGQQDPSH